MRVPAPKLWLTRVSIPKARPMPIQIVAAVYTMEIAAAVDQYKIFNTIPANASDPRCP